MESEDLSRRSLLQALTALVGAAALPFDWTVLAQVSHGAHAAASQKTGEDTLSFLTAAEAADVEAVAAQIIPTDDTPGARDAGVVFFIDRALATVLSHLAADYRSQLAAFQSTFREHYPGATSFAALGAVEQVEYLKTVDTTPFFDSTRLLTILGMFSMPVHGGNRNGVGWTLIGFEDRHAFQPPFGYYDREYPGFVDGHQDKP